MKLLINFSRYVSSRKSQRSKNPISMLRPIISATFPASSMAEDSNQRFSMSTSTPLDKHCSQNWVSRVNYRNGSSSIGRLSSFSIGIANGNRSMQEHSAGVPTSVPVRVARELLLAGHRYIDVRTAEEFSTGHVSGAINVPFLLRVGPGMTHNPKFLEEVLSHCGKDDEILVGCQLGKRSLMAATELLSAGFSGVTDMAGGYAAWVQNGLPTES
ncbi:thiosulfate sulfurtransferase 16, chloroplastic-like isoform X1 [Primulina eburnea]|uniref:thiosulfate sulfurtransferase 16, chloroplastic-like isoform X1 n=1 Tax=Primulina eburnea TaxID=1245227 RepID=UPI003C6BFF92